MLLAEIIPSKPEADNAAVGIENRIVHATELYNSPDV
ncbi:unknown [Bacteroides sp. CAG:1060]|nr:unknown [Bacteroides sp. CAG:1060]